MKFEFNKIGFTACYNLLQNEEEYKKIFPFIQLLIEEGGIFIQKDNKGELKLVIKNSTDIKKVIGANLYSDSIGILILENDIIKKILLKFINEFSADKSFLEKIKNWHDIYATIKQLWISIEIAADKSNLGLKISYWTYFPGFLKKFISKHQDGEDYQLMSEIEASNLVVKYLFDSVDNLFSTYIFHLGNFTFDPEQLRKSAFIFHSAIKSNNTKVLKFDYLINKENKILDIFIRDALLSSKGSDNLATQVVDDEILLINSSGFIGQTGQPSNINEPSLYLLLSEEKSHNVDLLDSLTTTIILAENTYQRYNNYLNKNIVSFSNAIDEQIRKSDILRNNLKIIPLIMASNVSHQEKIAAFSKFTLATQDIVEIGSRNTQLRQAYSELFLSLFSYLDLIERQYSKHNFNKSQKEKNYIESFLARAEQIQKSIYNKKDTLNLSSNEINKLIKIGQKMQNLLIDSVNQRKSDKENVNIIEEQKEFCFILSPFRPQFTELYEEIIKPIFDDPGLALSCIRADEIYGTQSIIKDIWNYIREAKFIIAELTDKNPNVLYELGLCHVLKKPVIMIVQKMDDVPFDLKHLRVIEYNTLPRGLKSLQNKLKNTMIDLIKSEDEVDVLPW